MKKIITLILVSVVSLYLIKSYFIPQTGISSNFKTELIDGSDFDLSNLRGKYVLIDFWASWCGPCIKEIPQLISLHNQFPEKLTIVSIALEKEYNAGIKATELMKFPWKNQIIEVQQTIYLSNIARKFGVTSIPAKFLMDPDGNFDVVTSFKDIEKILK